MFQSAYQLATQFTHPFLITSSHYDGHVESGLGTFVILNRDGWAMTAAHNFNVVLAYNQHQQEIKAYEHSRNLIHHSTQLNAEEKQSQESALLHNPSWITHYALLPAGNALPILENYIHTDHDIAFFRLDPAAFHPQTKFPKLINPKNISPGISLCKLGFPFVEFKAGFDKEKNQFQLPNNLLPLPLFPMEGIYTRNMLRGKSGDGLDILFLETSSPGLKGQSGGPIFDREGVVYAIQSQNVTIPLGYTGVGHIQGKGHVEENQFLNLGLGVHPLTLETLLNRYHIAYDKAG